MSRMNETGIRITEIGIPSPMIIPFIQSSAVNICQSSFGTGLQVVLLNGTAGQWYEGKCTLWQSSAIHFWLSFTQNGIDTLFRGADFTDDLTKDLGAGSLAAAARLDIVYA